MTPSQRLQAQRAVQQAADEALAKDLARRYGVAWETVKRELETITARIQAARAAGVTVDEAWLLRQGVLDRLAQAVQHETQVYVEHATGKIGEAQAVQQQMGAAHASALVQATTPTAFRPLAAILERTTMGGPLALLLEQIAPAAATLARDTLVAAVVAGDNPHTTARALKETLQAPLWRTLRIARTETIGAYRDAATATYRANRTTLAGWTWIAQLSPRTCAACWSLHGTVHPLDEPFASHPNCRCTPAPLTKSWEELGFPGLDETTLNVVPGQERFDSLSDADKLKVLGPSKFAAYNAGTLDFKDLAQPTLHPVWGPGIREASLRDLGLAPVAATPALAAPQWGLPIGDYSAADLQRMGYYDPDPNGEVGDIVPGPKLREQEIEIRKIGSEVRAEYDRTIAPELEKVAADAEELNKRRMDLSTERMQAEVDLHKAEEAVRADPALGSIHTDPTTVAARERFQRLDNEWESATVGARAAFDDLYERQRLGLIEVISQRRAMGEGGGVALAMGTGKATPLVREALEMYPRDWIQRGGSVKTRWTSGRAKYSPSRVPGEKGTINAGGRGYESAVHELGHYFEDEIPEIKALEYTFYQRRTRGGTGDWWTRAQESTSRLGSGYRRDEKKRDDEFLSPYMGKDYGNDAVSFYEIMSMGVERLATRDPFDRGLVGDDDMLDFVVGVLAGV